MTKRIAILGLAGTQDNSRLRQVDEIWTLNDWYRVCPHVKEPARIYQIHGDFKGDHLPGRYVDWRRRYNECGAEVVVMYPLGLKNERSFNAKRALKEYGVEWFTSTMSYMFADAMWDGDISEIYLEAVDLKMGDEFIYQVPGVLDAMGKCRDMGIKVHARMEDTWRKNLHLVDWKRVKQLQVPYWFGIHTVDKVKHDV